MLCALTELLFVDIFVSYPYTDGAKAEENATDVDADVVEVKKVKAATKIQAIFRGHNERRKYLKAKQNVVKVEAFARGFLTRKHVSEMKG